MLILFSALAFAQKVDNIELKSSKVFSDNEIKKWAGLNVGQNYFPGILDTSLARITTALGYNGYFNFSFEGSMVEFSNDSQKVTLVLNIDEGEPTVIQNIFFSSSDSINVDDYISSFNYLKGEIFNLYEIENIIDNLLSDFENEGFPFAAVRIQSVYLYDDSTNDDHLANIYLSLDEGNKSTIDKIEVTGNTSTKDYVIVRELRIEQGEVYSQSKVENLPRRLNKLRFFDPVPVPSFYLDSKNDGILHINVKERNTNNFDGIIGYIPPQNENESGYVTGMVDITLRNLFGTGRAAAISWEKLTRVSQELELKYLEPWLFGYPFNLNARLFQRIQDSTYVQRIIGGGIEYLATEDISATAFVLAEQVIPTTREVKVFTVYNSSSITTGVGLTIDLRDDPLATLSGFIFENSYSYSAKTINGPPEYISEGLETEINLQRITAGFGAYFEIFPRNVIALRVNGKELSGPFFEQSDLWRFGGTKTVRGYREEQFLASRIAWTNLEYRLMLSQRTYTFAFFDTGYYLLEPIPEIGVLRSEDFIFGYGIGIALDTAIGLLGVSFAFADGDTFSEGKIHFGIVNEF
ncbi:MAG: BamA/TamA family outer membrane protein [Ignavibacteriaceae bacterium]|nr:BamA/TamA family outer membrane protein [Ignavibacteriaceae bacterium]